MVHTQAKSKEIKQKIVSEQKAWFLVYFNLIKITQLRRQIFKYIIKYDNFYSI